ncbi:MAG: hypothetical protein KDC12_13030 [Flavobacteriales bacterium]|nr:hypothetical protein [Flavobacteriales bacterium]
MNYRAITRNLFALLALVTMFTSCYDETKDLARFYDSEMTYSERQVYSYYNWKETKNIALEIKTPEDGLIKVRALNGEILFQGYLVNGVLSELTLTVPEEIDQILIEYKDQIENVSCGAKKIRFAF